MQTIKKKEKHLRWPYNKPHQKPTENQSDLKVCVCDFGYLLSLNKCFRFYSRFILLFLFLIVDFFARQFSLSHDPFISFSLSLLCLHINIWYIVVSVALSSHLNVCWFLLDDANIENFTFPNDYILCETYYCCCLRLFYVFFIFFFKCQYSWNDEQKIQLGSCLAYHIADTCLHCVIFNCSWQSTNFQKIYDSNRLTETTKTFTPDDKTFHF